VDYRLELVPIPVSDVDRAKTFYAEKIGFNVDHDVNATTDHRVSDEMRVVQLTPPGRPARSPSGSGSWRRSPAPFRPYTWSSRT
jgi:catechol 2,3-dioxygenase-like lactoylglutathione lyase family enzyme